MNFPPYQSIDGGDLLQFFNTFPGPDLHANEAAAQQVFYAMATSPSIELTVNDETRHAIGHLQRVLSDGTFDQHIDNAEFSAAVNNSYSEAARQLSHVPLGSTGDKPIRLSLEKALPLLSDETRLTGYEIEMGANFHSRELTPHFILAETAYAPHLGWPALSFQIDRMPGRAPQIEVVTGPLDPLTRKSPDYHQAMSMAKHCIASSGNFEEVVKKYNDAVGERFRIQLSRDSLSFLEDGGSLGYDLVFPWKPELIARNVQATVQIPYVALANEHADIDRLFASDREFSGLLTESRKLAENLSQFNSLETTPTDRARSSSVFVHSVFELMANLAAGRNEYSDFKSKAPLIFRTSPEVIGPYLCQPSDRTMLRTMFSDRELLVNWAQTTLQKYANNSQSQRFLSADGTAELRTLIDSKCALIEQRLAIADKIGPYLVTRSGSVPGPDGSLSWIRPEMRQTLSLPPTTYNGELYIAIELRNRPAFSPFHRSHTGVPPQRTPVLERDLNRSR
ncbi:hypothetical protein [Burkholderia territorii]|uniref:hypothetical protein n=1 Tax=Burkholderia territorii TaxID=1503055 RepID=UPI0012D8BEC4|nr:hypothetical protein [Burkholderia territorii]